MKLMTRLNFRRCLNLTARRNNASKVHQVAEKGFTANEASMYNSGRPSYSYEALAKISEILTKVPMYGDKMNLVEIGAGTGKFTNVFHDFSKEYGLIKSVNSYTAVEPSDGFRDSLKSSAPPSVTVVNGTGAMIPVQDTSTDAVFVAQAFHWMANESTLSEVYRILKPSRPLMLIWNSYDYASSEWMKQIDNEILTPNYGDVPRQQSGLWRDCFQTDIGKKLFFPAVTTWENKVEHSGTEQLIYDRILSTSVIAEKSDAERAVIKEHLRHIIKTHKELETARTTGVFTIPYITELVWMFSRKPSW